MRALLHCIIFLFGVSTATLVPAESGRQGSGLPVPRFVALKSDEVNVRTGPGDRYPISWVYKRDHLPLEITEEFDHWRKIKDVAGSEGWIHKSLLDGRRYALIKKGTQVLRRSPEEDAAPLLRAAPMVIGKLLECSEDWCRMQIDSRKGWIQKKHLWGVYPKEVFE